MSDKISPFAALTCRDFSLLTVNQCCLTLAILIQEVLLSFYLYQLTHNPMMLGLVGLAEFLPFVLLSLWGGYLADRFNRQRILQLSFSSSIPLSGLLWLCFSSHQQQLLSDTLFLVSVYSIIFLFGCIRGIYSPCFNSLRPFLVPEKLYSNASTWTALCWQINAVLAPILAGLLLTHFGLDVTFMAVMILFALGSLALWQLKAREFPQLAQSSVWLSLKEAAAFLRQSRVLFWAMLLDVSSVFFGGVVALLPIFAQDVLHLDADGFGLLRAAPACGSLLMMSVLVKFPPQQQLWQKMLIAVAGFACCGFAFALSRHLYLAVLILLLMGACDSYSIVIRQTLLQLIPPKDMLGRIAAINGIFVTSSNQLGALQSSLMARLLSIIPAMLLGSSLSLLTVVLSYRQTRDQSTDHSFSKSG
ncbi:MFS transporter [Acinetobacter sp. ME22]|uniref:MFS transporter n=1 Tax=Acinetobacter sp. ME22 TaxID=2904802 RepID=UPI001EDB4A6E|nr:MFS transporter [Acinetobacter sp. ME22]MCG2573530.1 MFS transporter [Acinetobacter sp. ME22]